MSQINVDNISNVDGTKQIPVDEIVDKLAGPTGAFRLSTYNLAGVPVASDYDRCIIWINDLTGGPKVCYSDGTNWRRVSDDSIAD